MAARTERPTQNGQKAQTTQKTRKADRSEHPLLRGLTSPLVMNDLGTHRIGLPRSFLLRSESSSYAGRTPGATARPGLQRLLPILPILSRPLETRSHARDRATPRDPRAATR